MKDKPWMTPELRKELEDLEKLEGDERREAEYEYRLDQARVMATMLHEHYLRGYVEGSRQVFEQMPEAVRTQAMQRLVVKLLLDDIDVDWVAQLTGLPRKEVLALDPR